MILPLDNEVIFATILLGILCIVSPKAVMRYKFPLRVRGKLGQSLWEGGRRGSPVQYTSVRALEVPVRVELEVS